MVEEETIWVGRCYSFQNPCKTLGFTEFLCHLHGCQCALGSRSQFWVGSSMYFLRNKGLPQFCNMSLFQGRNVGGRNSPPPSSTFSLPCSPKSALKGWVPPMGERSLVQPNGFIWSVQLLFKTLQISNLDKASVKKNKEQASKLKLATTIKLRKRNPQKERLYYNQWRSIFLQHLGCSYGVWSPQS